MRSAVCLSSLSAYMLRVVIRKFADLKQIMKAFSLTPQLFLYRKALCLTVVVFTTHLTSRVRCHLQGLLVGGLCGSLFVFFICVGQYSLETFSRVILSSSVEQCVLDDNPGNDSVSLLLGNMTSSSISPEYVHMRYLDESTMMSNVSVSTDIPTKDIG